MIERSSNTSLLTLGSVADAAGITRPTLYSWIEAGLVTPRFDVEETVVFTPQERDQVKALAKERAEHRSSLRLARSSS